LSGLRAVESEDLARRAIALEVTTVLWNTLEAIAAVTLGLIAGSVALTGFGFDSVIEVLAALVVLRRLRADLGAGSVDELGEGSALRFVAATFVALACYITFSGVRDLLTHAAPETSLGGIVLTAVSLVVMPLLARAKRRTGEALGSGLVVAEAAETRLCAWLSASTLVGLAANAALGWWWADPVAGFVIAAFALREAQESWRGELFCE
jgi:divalent metal cation (Fe/Co/Zn/Cd) transporter